MYIIIIANHTLFIYIHMHTCGMHAEIKPYLQAENELETFVPAGDNPVYGAPENKTDTHCHQYQTNSSANFMIYSEINDQNVITRIQEDEQLSTSIGLANTGNEEERELKNPIYGMDA